MEDNDPATAVSEAIAELEEQAQGDVQLQADTRAMAGQAQTLTKKSMVRSHGVELPERVPFYRSRGGWLAMLPTVQLAYHLGKRHADGSAVFVKEKPEDGEKPIDQKCEVCIRNGGSGKVFMHEFDYITNMEGKHQREYRISQDRTKSASLTGNDVAVALMSMNREERQAIRILLGGDTDGGTPDAAASEATSRATCGDCGWEGKPVRNVKLSLAAHQRFRCASSGA